MDDIEAVNTVHRIIQDKDTALRVARALIADHERTIVAQRAELERVKGELATAQRRYLSAVDSRARFREAFRKARTEGKAARAWMQEYAEPLLSELEGYQNGDPDRAPYANRIAELEKQLEETRRERDQLSCQLGEAHQALAVAEETI